MRFVLLGAPGAGKGTVADKLKSEYAIAHISTGDLFRGHIESKSAFGEQIEAYMRRGELVPDAVTCDMVDSRLNEPDTLNGFLLDGFPRTVTQAEALAEMLERTSKPLDYAILVDCPDTVVMSRIAGRRVCTVCGRSYNVISMPPQAEGICDRCGAQLVQRPDDCPETVAARLKTYHDKTAPLIEYFRERQQLITFDNSGDFDSNYTSLLDRLNNGPI